MDSEHSSQLFAAYFLNALKAAHHLGGGVHILYRASTAPQRALREAVCFRKTVMTGVDSHTHGGK